MDVSIVIVSWNTKNLLRDCLKTVYEHAGGVDYEAIVVDNNSSDGSADMVRCEFPQVTIISNDTNRGYAAAANQGIGLAEGRYVLILNSDVFVCDNAIARLVEYADAHREAAVIGPQVWEDENTIQPTCFSYPNLLNLFLRLSGLARLFKNNHFFGREMMLWWRRDTERQVDVVSGMFMLVRREAIRQVGMMDESYFLYYEETDWCRRFSKAGWKMLFWPGAKVIHPGGGSHSSNQMVLRAYVQNRKSLLIFLKEHRGFASWVLARLMLAVDSAVRYCIWAARVLFGRVFGRDLSLAKQMRAKYGLVFKLCLFGDGGTGQRIRRILWQGLKETVEFGCALMYAVFLPFMRRRTRRVVLYYHDIKKADIGQFEKQMLYLARRHRVVKVSQIRTFTDNGAGSLVAVTFDDGLRNVVENALPILKREGIPAAIFVPTGNLGQRPRWQVEVGEDLDGDTVIDKKEVAELDRDGFEVFSHTVSHERLTAVEESKLRAELAQSKEELERITGHQVEGVSYPYGAYDSVVCDAARQAGYKFGFTIEPRRIDCSADDLQMGRFAVKAKEGLLKFRLKAIGAYQIVGYLRGIKALLVSR